MELNNKIYPTVSNPDLMMVLQHLITSLTKKKEWRICTYHSCITKQKFELKIRQDTARSRNKSGDKQQQDFNQYPNKQNDQNQQIYRQNDQNQYGFKLNDSNQYQQPNMSKIPPNQQFGNYSQLLY